ncbi:MAG: hypothetical protein JRN24_01500 [Nitrososphaerota archaeon]|nr:hypothetical protein [Nitrososphaerota archaeon]
MSKLIEWTAKLSDRDAPVSEFLAGEHVEVDLTKRIRSLQAQQVQTKEYGSHQGATVTPRPFWVVRVRTATRGGEGASEEITPLVSEDSIQVQSSERASLVIGAGKRKQVWRGISLDGSASSGFLFGLLTSRYVGNFSVLHRDLSYLPAVTGNGGLDVLHYLAARATAQRTLEVEDAGERQMRDWVKAAQAEWKAGRKKDQQELCTERLDYNGGLASQPALSHRVVHTRSGNFYAALLNPASEASTGLSLNKLKVKSRRNGKVVGTQSRPLAGVIVDNLLHWIEVGSVVEGYWLVGVLNSDPFISQLEKDVQGRDFYSAPSRLLARLNLRYDPSNPTHAGIADAAKLIESIKTVYDRELLAAQLGSELSLVDDTDVSPEVPRLKWSFSELCQEKRECSVAFAKINSLVSKMIR